MTTVKISELHSAGSKLFSDSESYMKEISEAELNSSNINGGGNGNLINAIGTGTITLANIALTSPYTIPATPS